jgi:CspA family cold shock protein
MNQDQTITGARGIVKWLTRSYGFITSEDVGADVFVHFEHIEGEGHRSLYEGERVSFTAVLTEKGWQAREVRRR